ncbi:hypothetical protein C8N46_11428 [Kordia periserrulae]|uniref:Phage abortive infection protein n=1 Tax=Kordia periserrulae TaxID=701523 RepID=A0A2T6BQL0_9FLAO|nr:hypothetical protein [Kordia periserrulae]PTX58383.1 hypothetical protein C8N46_11428 [Kordia periserrulae]
MNDKKFDEEIAKTEKTIKKIRFFGWFFVFTGFIFLIVGLYYWFLIRDDFNEVGDFIGGVSGSLWALAGLFFIYIAFLGQKIEIKNQQKELALNRKELELNRQELEESRKVFKAQAEIMLDQKLDTTFFNLLDNHRKLIDSFKRGENKNIGSSISFFNNNYNKIETVSGYEVLQEIYDTLNSYLHEYSNYLKNRNIFDSEITNTNPISLIKKYRYIELLYNEVSGIIEFISNKIKKDNRDFYFKTLFNNLSNEEKFLLTTFNINVSDKHIPELNFEDYLRLGFIDFSSEVNFLSFKNFFFREQNLKKEINERVIIKIIDENPKDYSEFNIYIVKDDKKEIIDSIKIMSIQQEIPVYGLLLNITKQYFSEKIKEKKEKKDSRQKYNIILQGINKINNFCMYDFYDIIIGLNNEELVLYTERNYNFFSDWIKDYFNDKEN